MLIDSCIYKRQPVRIDGGEKNSRSRILHVGRMASVNEGTAQQTGLISHMWLRGCALRQFWQHYSNVWIFQQHFTY